MTLWIRPSRFTGIVACFRPLFSFFLVGVLPETADPVDRGRVNGPVAMAGVDPIDGF
jgi:hypothetical protein